MCLGMLRSMSGILTLIGNDSFDVRLCLMFVCVLFSSSSWERNECSSCDCGGRKKDITRP